jgi:hypothetical protein
MRLDRFLTTNPKQRLERLISSPEKLCLGELLGPLDIATIDVKRTRFNFNEKIHFVDSTYSSTIFDEILDEFLRVTLFWFNLSE